VIEFEADPLSDLTFYYLNPTTGQITLKRSLLLGSQLSDIVSTLLAMLHSPENGLH